MVNNPSLIDIQDEGVSQGQVTRLNVTGGGASASVAGTTGTINVPGAAGASWTTVEVNLGSSPRFRGTFTITDAAISPSSKVIVLQAPGPYTNKGTRADEAEMDFIDAIAYPGSGSASVVWQTKPYMVQRLQYPTYQVQIVAPVVEVDRTHIQGSFRRGQVRGNVKFMYTVI